MDAAGRHPWRITHCREVIFLDASRTMEHGAAGQA